MIPKKQSEIGRTHFLVSSFVCSAISNLLALTGPIFMIIVIDKVLTTKSQSILISFTIIALIAYVNMFAIDFIRSKIIFSYAQSYLEKDTKIAELWMSRSVVAFFDLPWALIFLICLFAIHWIIGMSAIAVIGVHCIALIYTKIIQKKLDIIDLDIKKSQKKHQELTYTSSLLPKNDKAILFGLQLLQDATKSHFIHKYGLEHKLVVLASILQVFRLSSSTGIIAIGASLAVSQNLSPGAIIAASILLQRCIVPLEIIRNSLRQIPILKQWIKKTEEIILESSNLESWMPQDDEKNKNIEKKIILNQWRVFDQSKKKVLLQIPQLEMPTYPLIGLIGPAESGKTLFLKGLCNILPNQSDAFLVNGYAINTYKGEALINYIPSEFVGLSLVYYLKNQHANFKKNNLDKYKMLVEKLNISETIILKLLDKISQDLNYVNFIPKTIQRKMMLFSALSSDFSITIIDDIEVNLNEEELKDILEAIKIVAYNESRYFIVSTKKNTINDFSNISVFFDRLRIKEVKLNKENEKTT